MINNVHLFYSLASSRSFLNPSFIHLPRAKRNQQAREDLLERTFSKSSCLTSEETNSDGAQPRCLYFWWIGEGEHFMTPGTILIHPNKLAYPCAKYFFGILAIFSVRLLQRKRIEKTTEIQAAPQAGKILKAEFAHYWR